MKKVFLVLALVVAYGVSMASTASEMVTVNDVQATVVMDADESTTPEAEKSDAKSEAKSEAKSKSDSKGCSSAKSESKGCSDKKTAEAKSDCSSSCSGKKK